MRALSHLALQIGYQSKYHIVPLPSGIGISISGGDEHKEEC